MKAAATSPLTGNGFLYEKVAARMAELIRVGTLRPGDRLPSIRRICQSDDVSLATAIQAYRTLENRGLVEAKPKSGFVVRTPRWIPPAEPTRSRPPRRSTQVTTGELMMRMQEASRSTTSTHNFATACPHEDLLPSRTLLRLMHSAGLRSVSKSLRAHMPPGYAPLRSQIALRLANAGAIVSPSEIVTTHGCQEALDLCLRTVTQRGDTVAIESPCYFGILQLVEALGLKVCEIPTYPREGVCLRELESRLDRCRIKACLFNLNFSNPLGSMMPDAKKEQLVWMLQQREIPLLEDDVFGELSAGPNRPRSAKSFDKKGLVLSTGSFSKTLAPGYRVGWCVPGRYLDQIKHLKYVTTMGSMPLPEIAIAEFLANGGYDRHLQKIRNVFAESLQKTAESVARAFPKGTKISRPQGGFVLWIELPTPCDSRVLFDEAIKHGIIIAPGPIFSATGQYQNCLRLNCGNPWNEKMDRAIQKLGSLIT